MINKPFLLFLIFYTTVPNAFSETGKSYYFLRSRSFQGDPPEMGNLYEDPASIDTSAAHKVLFGHYSALLESRPSQSQSEAKIKLTSRSVESSAALQKSQLSKVIEIYRMNLFTTIQAAVNYTKGSQPGDFLNQLESCRDELKKCNGLGDDEIRCGVECLGKGKNILNSLTTTITALKDHFCRPIDTIFDHFFEVNGKVKHPNLRKYVLFLKRVADAKKSWSDVAVQGASSLLPIIVDKVKTDMMPFRLFNDKLETALQVEHLFHPSVDPTSMITNYLCSHVENANIAESLLDVLYRNPTLVDAIFGGLTSINLISKYLPGRFRVPFAAASEAVRILTGSICGLIEYAETGRVPACDQIGGFPVPGIPLPEIPEMPNLRQECLQGQGNALNEEDATESDANLSKAPPIDRSKRELGAKTKAALTAREDGASVDKSTMGLHSNGVGGRKKRSLVVGMRKSK